jgi:signal transduction histidine kinase
MKLRNSIRVRFVVTLVVFLIVIMTVFAGVVSVLQRSILEDLFQQRISSELQHFSDRYQIDKQTPLPDTRDLNAYLDTEKLPLYLQKIASKLPDGIYFEKLDDDEFEDADFKDLKFPADRKSKFRDPKESDDFESEDSGFQKRKFRRERKDSLFHGFRDRDFSGREPEWADELPHSVTIGIKTLSDKKRLYLVADRFYIQIQREKMLHSMGWTLILVCFAGVILALYMAKRVTAPMKQLADMIETSGPDNLPTGFSQLFRSDEFGTLAQALERSMDRIKSFITREHQFTRDASHELRTPVTVVKGALELLRMTPAYQDESSAKLLKRVERSVMDMENTIESLLWLAREESGGKTIQACYVLPVVENAIEQNRHLIAGKPVEMILKTEAEPVISLPSGVLAIAVSNLIRNACQFTYQGTITVIVKSDRIEVVDTGSGIEESDLSDITAPGISSKESSGFGFGLDIVNRLCDQFDWQLKIESTPGQGTRTQLIITSC